MSTSDALEGALATLRELLGMDVAYVAEFTGGRQVYRAIEGKTSSFGLQVGEGPAEEGTYCFRMLSGRLANVVPDTAVDERVADLEITANARIGAYVAVPLVFPNGSRGSLCCLSHEADSRLAERDLRYMRAIGRLIEDHLVQRELEREVRAGLDRELIRGAGQLRTALAKLDASQAELVLRLSRAVDYRDDDTGAHTERVARHAEALARAARLDAWFCEKLLLAAPLHDAGKVAVPDAVLLKPGKLDAHERLAMNEHARVGYELLRNSASDVLELAASVAWTHHERFDGGGYPRGLSGHEIPIEGRVVAIADVYDALTNDRVYRAAFTSEQAVEIMCGDEGHFDPALLAAFIDLLPA
jgi:response regulator RpfG family c-di-GMP phosphodiesterase